MTCFYVQSMLYLFLSFIRKAILPIENEICPPHSDEAFEEGQTEVVIKKSMYDVQKNIFSIAKSNISKAQCCYKSDYDKKHCKGKGSFNMYLCICI